MGKSSTGLDPALYDYIIDHSLREPDVLTRLRAETDAMPNGNMQISPDEGQFLRLLIELIGAKNVIEIGTFTGYSALSMAMALPQDGTLICCDVSDEYTQIGRPYWQEAGVDSKIDLRLAPALETLAALEADGKAGSFDMAFIDADKENYQGYVDACLRLLRQGGLICIDNVLWGGDILDEQPVSEETLAIQALNRSLKTDERVSLSMLSIADGLTLAVKR